MASRVNRVCKVCRASRPVGLIGLEVLHPIGTGPRPLAWFSLVLLLTVLVLLVFACTSGARRVSSADCCCDSAANDWTVGATPQGTWPTVPSQPRVELIWITARPLARGPASFRVSLKLSNYYFFNRINTCDRSCSCRRRMLKQRSRLHVLRWCQNTKWTWRRQTLWRQSKRRWNGWTQTVRRRSKKRWPCGSPSNIRHLCWSVRHGKGRLDQRLRGRIGER